MVRTSAGQRVDVEVTVAPQRHAADKAVVEGLLDNVGVAAIAGKLEQAVIPHHERDGGAGLGIRSLVREGGVEGETLVLA